MSGKRIHHHAHYNAFAFTYSMEASMKLKELGTRIRSFIIVRKVQAVILAVILSASIAGGTVYHSISSAQASAGTMTDYKTFNVKKTDMEKNLSVTGTIISSEENTANASTSTSYPIASVKVKVGDTVKAGDVPVYPGYDFCQK